MSLDEIGQLWLIYIKDNRKYSTYRKYANIYDMHIRDTFGSLTADQPGNHRESSAKGYVRQSVQKYLLCTESDFSLWKPILRHSKNSFKSRKTADSSQTRTDNKRYRPAEAMPLSALRS